MIKALLTLLHDIYTYRASDRYGYMVIWRYGGKKTYIHVARGLGHSVPASRPPSRRSQYVAAAIATKLRERDEEIARACELANNSADVRLIETSFDALADEADTVQEPW